MHELWHGLFHGRICLNKPSEQTVFFKADIDENGAILLPPELRELMGINFGDDVRWLRDGDCIRLRKK